MDNLRQVDFCYKGAISNLSQILKIEKAVKALVFTGKKSFESIKPVIEKELSNVKFQYFNDFSTNPKKEEVDDAVATINEDIDIIIAIGGGSVIDFAKAFRYYSDKKCKLVAIPTTCGTGSESTQFAVIYENGVKKSLDDKSILPDYAIVDCTFVVNNPKYIKACTSMDAYCQAIESYWAVNSTEESREYAKNAIILCKENIVDYVNTNSAVFAEKMSEASHLAGKAINISRTTASHALSYKITSQYAIPHGHAVALTIAQLFEANCTIDENTINDKRGVEFVKARMLDLKELICENPVEYFEEIFNKIGLNYRDDFDIELLANSVNIERLSNNPKKLSNSELKNLLKIPAMKK